MNVSMLKVLMWKKYKLIKQNFISAKNFFIYPIILLVILAGTSNNEAVLCYFSFIITAGVLSSDLESTCKREYAMYTPLSLKEDWFFQGVIDWIFRFTYSFIIMIVGMIAYKLFYGEWYASWFLLVIGIINGISGFGFILFTTQYEMDLVKWKQVLMFTPVLVYTLVVLIICDKTSNFVPTGFVSCICLFIFSALLIVFSFWKSKNISIEQYINSLDEMRNSLNISTKISIMDD